MAAELICNDNVIYFAYETVTMKEKNKTWFDLTTYEEFKRKCLHSTLQQINIGTFLQLQANTSEIEAKEQTFAVLSTTFLQSGKMLTDHAGKWYELPLNVTVASDLVS